ncbi:carboxymuconolactone decarboxylase family protein [Mycobacterium sp. NPDC003323]
MTQTLQNPTAIDRMNIYKVSPEIYDGMMKLSNAAAKDIDPTIGELIKIRASQINHCAFCLDMHVADAREQGETEQRLALIAAWEEAGDLFTEQERAALELTEAITSLHDGHVPDAVYAKAAEVFSEKELAQVIAMAVTINAWNRFNVATRMPAPRR